MSASAAKQRISNTNGMIYWQCRHDPTVLNPVPCSFFQPLPHEHPFAGFCRFNMARPDSQSVEDFGDLCHSRAAIDAARAKEGQS